MLGRGGLHSFGEYLEFHENIGTDSLSLMEGVLGSVVLEFELLRLFFESLAIGCLLSVYLLKLLHDFLLLRHLGGKLVHLFRE